MTPKIRRLEIQGGTLLNSQHVLLVNEWQDNKYVFLDKIIFSQRNLCLVVTLLIIIKYWNLPSNTMRTLDKLRVSYD